MARGCYAGTWPATARDLARRRAGSKTPPSIEAAVALPVAGQPGRSAEHQGRAGSTAVVTEMGGGCCCRLRPAEVRPSEGPWAYYAASRLAPTASPVGMNLVLSRTQLAGTAMAAHPSARHKPWLGARRSALGARRSALGARRSALGIVHQRRRVGSPLYRNFAGVVTRQHGEGV